MRYIATEEAERLHVEPGTLFLDARTLEEYEHGHIPGALHLGRANFETDFPAVESQLKTPTTLVVYPKKSDWTELTELTEFIERNLRKACNPLIR